MCLDKIISDWLLCWTSGQSHLKKKKFLCDLITGFVDVSPEESVQKSPFESFKDVDESSSFKEARAPAEVSF